MKTSSRLNNKSTLIRNPTHNRFHRHLTIRCLSNISLSNVTNTQRRHSSCGCCAFVLVGS